jgi:hypothetical protein
VEQKTERKEGLTVKKQTFIEALMDEGVTLTSKERKLIRDADQGDWELFLARVMIRGKFGKDMLDALRPEPETVIVKREE